MGVSVISGRHVAKRVDAVPCLLWGGYTSVAVRTAVAVRGPVADPFEAALFIRSRSKERAPSTLLGVTLRRLERSRETSVFERDRLSRTTKGKRVSVGTKGQTLHPNPSSDTLSRLAWRIDAVPLLPLGRVRIRFGADRG